MIEYVVCCIDCKGDLYKPIIVSKENLPSILSFLTYAEIGFLLYTKEEWKERRG